MAIANRPEGIAGGARGGSIGKGRVKPELKRTLAEPKSGVRVKPPARTAPAPQNRAKINANEDMSIYRSMDAEGNIDSPVSVGKKRNLRIINSKNQTASGKSANHQPRIGGHSN